jgi:hypothetical protein
MYPHQNSETESLETVRNSNQETAKGTTVVPYIQEIFEKNVQSCEEIRSMSSIQITNNTVKHSHKNYPPTKLRT